MPGEFNPANALIRNAWETTQGVATETGWHYHDFVSETLSSDPGVIQDPSITSDGEEPEDLESKIATDGVINVALNAEGHAHYLANFMGASATPVDLTGAYRHKMSPAETDVTFPETMSIEISRDDDMPQMHRGAMVRGVQLSLSPRGLLTTALDIVSERADYFSSATQTAGTSTDPHIRGLLNQDNIDAADPDVFLKCQTAASKLFRAKLGSASSYGATSDFDMEFLTAGTWYELDKDHQATPERFGTRALPVEVMFPNFTGLADNDIWRFDHQRAVWVPSMPDVPKFNEIYALIYIDGATVRIRQVQLNLQRPATPEFNIGGRYADQILRRGRRTARGSMLRSYVDTDLRNKLERGTSFQLRIVAYSGVYIGATTIEHQLSIHALNCKFSGRTPVVQNGQTIDENMNFSCHPSSDGTYPSAVTLELTTSQADLAA